MKQVVLKIHLYGGLLCSAYLLIYGFSSLQFNHRFSFAEPRHVTNMWEAALTSTLPKDNLKAADQLRDDLGLMGWPLPWKMSRNPVGVLTFDLEQPGKSYTIRAAPAEKKVFVEARGKGFWPVVNSLHGFNGLPNSTFASFWGYYTDFSVFVVLFASISGIWLWVATKRERLAGIIMLLGAAALSIGFMAYVILKG